MREEVFEYTDSKLTLKLLGLCFLIFVVIAVLAPKGKTPWTLPVLIAAFGIPLTIFLLNKKKIKKEGSVTINDSNAEFKLEDSVSKIEYSEIQSFKIEHNIGTILNIKLKNGTRFKLEANSNFCDHFQFDEVCQLLKKSIRQFKSSNNVPVIRKGAKLGLTFALLVIVTSGLFGGAIYLFYQGGQLPVSFYVALGIIATWWTSYINAKRRQTEDKD